MGRNQDWLFQVLPGDNRPDVGSRQRPFAKAPEPGKVRHTVRRAGHQNIHLRLGQQSARPLKVKVAVATRLSITQTCPD